MHVAVASDNAPMALKLVDAGADPSAQDKVSDASCVSVIICVTLLDFES